MTRFDTMNLNTPHTDREIDMLPHGATGDIGMPISGGLDGVTLGLLDCLRDTCAHLSMEGDVLKSSIALFAADGTVMTMSTAPEDAETLARVKEIDDVICRAVSTIRATEQLARALPAAPEAGEVERLRAMLGASDDRLRETEMRLIDVTNAYRMTRVERDAALAQVEALKDAQGEPVALTYRNWRGEVAERTMRPIRIWFGATDWHPEPQWLLTAFDIEKWAERDFALKDFGCAAPASAGVTVKPLTLPEVRNLWKQHGGRVTGPRVETWSMPESQVMVFLAALSQHAQGGEGAEG